MYQPKDVAMKAFVQSRMSEREMFYIVDTMYKGYTRETVISAFYQIENKSFINHVIEPMRMAIKFSNANLILKLYDKAYTYDLQNMIADALCAEYLHLVDQANDIVYDARM